MLKEFFSNYIGKNIVPFRKNLAYPQSVNAIVAAAISLGMSIFFLLNIKNLGIEDDGTLMIRGIISYLPLIIGSVVTLISVPILRKFGSKYWRALEAITLMMFTVIPLWGTLSIKTGLDPRKTVLLLLWALTIFAFSAGLCVPPAYTISILIFLYILIFGFMDKNFTLGEKSNCAGIILVGGWCSILRFRLELREFRYTEEKDAYLARISHEIRTPINTMLGTNELIRRECKDENILEYTKDVSSSGNMLLSLINDILDLSKLESEKMPIVEDEYSLKEMVKNLESMIRFRAQSAGLSFTLFFNGELPDKLKGDEVRVKQVIMNLLTNAVKYTDRGGVTLRVTGVTRGDEVTLVFHVLDTGIGIKKEDIKKLQEDFYRIEEKRNHRIEGTGLGLNIVTRLLEAMNGKLSVTSEYGVGSEFIATIPQKVVDPTTVYEVIRKERVSTGTKSNDNKPLFKASQASILVVDDNRVNLKLFKKLLEYTEVKVDLLTSGQEMLETIKHRHYDIIFLDHMMPGLDGIETKMQMEKDPGLCKDTPVIALTANERTDGKEYYQGHGFDNYLSKPIDILKLEEMVKNYLPNELLDEMV